MNNKCKKILVTIFALFLCISSFYASSDNVSVPKDAIINPNYIAYESLNDSEKSKVSIVPIKYLFEYKDSSQNSIFKSVSSVRNTVSAYPSTYNLTNVGGVRYVPAVKNQGTLGLCWAFASNTTLESYFLRANKGTYNLSENQPDYVSRYIGDTATFGDGNSLFNVMKYWFLGLSPVSESNFGSYFTTMKTKTTNEFLNTDNTIIDTKEVKVYPYVDVSNYVKTNFATAKSKITSYNEQIKNSLMNYGALTSTIYTYFLKEDKSTGNFYLYNDGSLDESIYSGSGHAITIIGWNDSYLDITGDGVGDGAWIAQNSWGNYAPYFYISYYDIDVVKTFMGVLDASSKEWDNSYVDHQDYYSTPTSEVFTFYKGETNEELDNVKIFYEGYDYDTVVNVSASDGTNSMESTGKTLNYGINTFSFNDLGLTGDKVNITVTGASSLYYHIAMFTKESEDTPNLYLYESPLNSFTNTVDNQLDYHIITKNVLNDTAYTIKVLDNTNNDITSKFTLSNKINILNNYASFTLKLNEVLDVDGFRVIVSTSNLNDNIQYNIDLKIVGTGTEADPYIISSPEDLILLDSSDAYFKLNNNIDLDRPTTSSYGIFYNSGKGWAPINFYGSLDGSGYKITNLNSTVGGLFGMLYGATVKNLKIENANIVLNSTDTNVNDNVGIFAKIIYNKSNVSNISIDNGYIKGLNGTGGLCGVVYSATINNIKINATITGDNIVGGITAYIIDDYNHTSDININNVFVNNSKVYGGETKYIGLLAGLLSYYGDATGYLPANDLSNNRYNTIAVNDYKNAEDTFGFTAYTIDNDTTNYNPFETDIKSNNNQVLSNADKILTASYTNFDLDTLWSVGSEGAYLKLFYTPEELAVVSLLYKNATITEDNYILGVSPKTGLNTAESNITIDSVLTYKIYNRNGNLISSTTATIGTGGYIEITNGYEFKDYEIIVYGDVTGDGKISISDILNMADYSIASSETKETIFPLKSQIIAADVNKDSKISISDVFKVADYSINPALGF